MPAHPRRHRGRPADVRRRPLDRRPVARTIGTATDRSGPRSAGSGASPPDPPDGSRAPGRRGTLARRAVDQSRTQRPGAVRPARPARCSAEARLIRSSDQRSTPRSGSNRTSRTWPLSITVRTPSMVSEVSAMFVLRMIFRRSPGRRASSCSSAVSDPCSGRMTAPGRLGHGLQPSPRPADLGHAGQEDQQVARFTRVVEPLLDDRRQRFGTRRPVGRAVGDVDGMRSPLGAGRSDNRRGMPATGSASRVADITTMRRSGRTSSRTFAQQGQGQVGLQAALVELVEHHGADGSRGRGRRGAGGSGRPR